jgi:hypothetical protein
MVMALVAGFSFLLHFGALAALFSDWADPIVPVDGDMRDTLTALVRFPLPMPGIPAEEPHGRMDHAPDEGVGAGKKYHGCGPRLVTEPPGQRSSEGWSLPYFPAPLCQPDWNAVFLKLESQGCVLHLPPISVNGPVVPKPIVSGGVGTTGARVNGVIGLARAKARACYQAGLASNPDMEGSVSFTLSISREGSVSSASVSPGGNLSIMVISCIKSGLGGLSFDAPEDGDSSTISGFFKLVNASKGNHCAGGTNSPASGMLR